MILFSPVPVAAAAFSSTWACSLGDSSVCDVGVSGEEASFLVTLKGLLNRALRLALVGFSSLGVTRSSGLSLLAVGGSI